MQNDVQTSAATIPKGRWLRVIPPAMLIYIISYMDRMNIGFAMAGGMNESLNISMTISGLAAGIFFFGYLFLQIPGGHIAEHGKAKKFIFWTIIGWGGCSILTGFAQNQWQLLTLRFLLGVAEGGVWPAILVIIGNWFPAKELGRANAFFMSSLCISVIITTPLSGWIVGMFDWRWLFIIEGIISLALIFIWLPLISDRPENAKWISKEEKEYLVETLRLERENFSGTEKAPVSYKQIFSYRNTWLLIVIYFCNMTGQYGFLMWLPTIIKNLTKQGMTNVGLLAAVPYIAAMAGLYFFAVLSDRSLNRRFYTTISQIGLGLSFLLSTQFPAQIWVCYGFLVLTGFFTKAFTSNFWTMPPLLFPPGVAGGARGIVNAMGNLGGFAGPFLVGYITTLLSMQMAIYCLVVFILIGAVATLILPDVTSGKIENSTDVTQQQKSS
jgi:MFS family permease